MADINLSAEQVAALILSIGDKSKLKTAEKKTLVDAINNLIDSNLAPTSVLYTPMELSNESKEQARENIGAGVEEYRIPLSYDEESGEWSTIITPKNLYSAYSAGKQISAYVDLSPISTIKDKKTFRAETIRATRGLASGTFVSVDTDKITKLIFHTSEDYRSFAITEETTVIAGLQDEVFIVTADFDTTNMTITNASHTFAEIAAAYDAQKIVFLRAGTSEFEATAKVVNAVQFIAPSGSITYSATVRNTGVWTVSKVEKVNEITDSATNSQYPSALAVVNYVESHGGAPLYIRGTLTPAPHTFIPETDYTPQEINDAFMAGRYVAVVVSNYIVPLVNTNNNYAEFNLSKVDPRDFSTYVYINVVRTLSGWEIVFDES